MEFEDSEHILITGEKSPFIQSRLKVFTQKFPELYDVKFSFSSSFDHINALKCIMASNSTFFKKVLYEGEGNVKLFSLEETNPRHFSMFVEYAMFHSIPNIEKGKEYEEAVQIFNMVRKYGISESFQEAVASQLTMCFTPQNFINIFDVGVSCNSICLAEVCKTYLLRSSSDVFREISCSEGVTKVGVGSIKEFIVLLRASFCTVEMFHSQLNPFNGEEFLLEEVVANTVITFHNENAEMEKECLELLEKYINFRNIDPETVSTLRTSCPLFRKINGEFFLKIISKELSAELILLGCISRDIPLQNCFFHESIPKKCETLNSIDYETETSLIVNISKSTNPEDIIPPPPKLSDYIQGNYSKSGRKSDDDDDNESVDSYPNRSEYEDLDMGDVGGIRSTFGKDMREFLTSTRSEGKGYDVVFVVGDFQVRGVRALLGAGSEFFGSMLYGNMKESKESVIKIDCEFPVALQCIVDFIMYESCSVPYEHLMTVLCLATEYMIEELVDALTEHIQASVNSTNCIDLLKSALVLENYQIFNACVTQLSREFPSTVLESERLLTSSSEELEEYLCYFLLLLRDDTVFMDDEKDCNFNFTLYRLLHKWGMTKKDAREKEMRELMEKYVNYSLIWKDDILKIKVSGNVHDDLLFTSLFGLKDTLFIQNNFKNVPEQCATMGNLFFERDDFSRMLSGFVPSPPPVSEMNKKKKKKKGGQEAFNEFLRDFATDWVNRDGEEMYEDYPNEEYSTGTDDDDGWGDDDDYEDW